MHRQRKPNPEVGLYKRREYEERLANIQQAVQADQALGAAAAWEARTDAKIQQLQVQRRFEALRARRAANIDARREQLASRLHQEEQALKAELVEYQETPAQRRAQMAERARELARKREAERQHLADELLEQAFRENCDSLRERFTKQILYRTAAERQHQIQEKMELTLLKAEESQLYADMYEAERLKKEQRHLTDVRRQQEGAGDLKRSLDAQVAAVRERQAAEHEQEWREVQRMQEHWTKLEAEAVAAEAAERHRLAQLAEEVKEFNRLKQLELSEAELQERELDLHILQAALAREAEEEAADLAAREAKRQEVVHYRTQLSRMMAKEAEEKGEQDAMIESANRAKQAAEDAEWARREAARQQLMAEVDAIRQLQIKSKRDSKDLAKEEQRLERLRLEQEEKLETAERNAAAARAKRVALTQRLDVETQMVARSHMRAAEAEDKQHAAQLAQGSEARYMERVAAAEKAIAPQTYFGRKKVEWFH